MAGAGAARRVLAAVEVGQALQHLPCDRGQHILRHAPLLRAPRCAAHACTGSGRLKAPGAWAHARCRSVAGRAAAAGSAGWCMVGVPGWLRVAGRRSGAHAPSAWAVKRSPSARPCGVSGLRVGARRGQERAGLVHEPGGGVRAAARAFCSTSPSEPPSMYSSTSAICARPTAPALSCSRWSWEQGRGSRGSRHHAHGGAALCSRPSELARPPPDTESMQAQSEPARPRLAALGRMVRADEADQARVVHLAQRLHIVHHLVALVLRRVRGWPSSQSEQRPHAGARGAAGRTAAALAAGRRAAAKKRGGRAFSKQLIRLTATKQSPRW